MNSLDQRRASRPRRHRLPTLSLAIFASLSVVTFVVTAGASAKPAGSGATNLQQDVDALVAAGAPGAILLVRNGNKTTHLVSGVADLATQRKIGQGDHYRIASLTKTYVAAVVLQLAAEGKLRLSDTVERWLPGLVPNGEKITIRMLLIHTSGLYDHERDPEVLKPYLDGDLSYYWSPTRLVKLAVSRPELFAPGATKLSSYSSTNYVILGLVVSAVTGRSVGAELKQRIFEPLHLAKSTYPTRQTQLPNPYAHGYLMLGPPTLTDLSAFSPSLSGAAGAIVSTVDDVAVFYRALLSGRLLKPAQLNAMKKTLPEAKGDLVQRMGYGLIRFSTPCGAAWGHSGSFPGYWTHAWSSGDGKRQAVLMVNIDPGSVSAEGNAAFYKTLRDAYCGTP
jgi:D-alanyl-D-alanine carboxypeptidase